MHFSHFYIQPNLTSMNNTTYPEERLESNVDGPFFVTDNCIDCDLCRENAPGIFGRDDEIGYSIVIRQPATEAETEEAREALEACPTEAIVEWRDRRPVTPAPAP